MLEAEPDAAYAYNEIGTVYQNLKQYDKAQAALEAAIDLAPNWSYHITHSHYLS